MQIVRHLVRSRLILSSVANRFLSHTGNPVAIMYELNPNEFKSFEKTY